VALAEHIAGGEDAFVGLMNQYAAQLGMSNTTYKNSTGWPDPEHMTTARDIATLSAAVIREFPEHYSWYAEKVFIFEQLDQVRADEILQSKAKEQGIEVLVNKEITAIKGNDQVEKVEFKDLETKETFSWDIEGVFVEIGFIPNTNLVKDLLKLNKKGEIKVDKETCQTSVRGVYGAGDNNDLKYRQIITSASEGAKAALSAYEFLHHSD